MTTINAGAAATNARISGQESLGGGARSILPPGDPLILTLADVADEFPEFRLWTRKIPCLSPERTALVVGRLKRWAMRSSNGKGCIEWAGARDRDNYGRINFRISGGRHCAERAHRVSVWLKTGKEIPFYMEAAHVVCDNPPCFNPAHVEAQRRRDNRERSAVNTNLKKAAAAARMAA